MSILTIDYNQKKDKNLQNLENYKTINKKFLTLEDINLIDLYYHKYDYILIKNQDLRKRKDFNLENFKNSVLEDNEIDIYILSSYAEKCQNLTEITSYQDYQFYKSRVPGEIEAFIFKGKNWPTIKESLKSSSEEKITKALKNLAYNDDLNMAFSWPQVYYKKEDSRFLKICREESLGIVNPKIKEISYYWFFVNLFFSVLFLYVIYDKIPKDKYYHLSRKN